ncbi:MAG: PilZ domain-containing protein [Spirochaetaceae bacterium]|jgi:hypothetical protein|nr:PilZ domain-containing protein [Spirochaetaceae bacterium]
MATPIQRIEKEYILGTLNGKNIPLKCFAGKHEHTFTLREIGKDRLIFESKDSLSVFQKNMKIELKFSVHSTLTDIITFSVYVYEAVGRRLITSIPDYLYKNLSRAYSRVRQTPGLNMVIRKNGFYYDLDCEKISGVDSAASDNLVLQLNEADVNAAMNEHLNWIQQKTDGYKLVLFKDNVLSSPASASLEEKAVGKRGKILFISIPSGGFVSEAENSGEMFFTEQSLTEYLLDNGENPESARKKIDGLLNQRVAQGVCSDCYIPVIFRSYIIGYMHIWVNEGENPPLTLSSIEKFRRFAKIIVLSLEWDNYFEGDKKEIPPFSPKLLDMSAGGFLFVLDPSKEKITYAVDDQFAVRIAISDRVIRCKASVVRNHSDMMYAYYGCKFDDMAIEDTRFLFEAIYGKPFTDNDIQFVAGAV